MSIKIMSQVWEHSKHKGSPLLLMLAIADFADDEGAAFPGVERLAKKIRMSPRQTQRLIVKLTESKELTIKRNKGISTETGRTNLYKITVKPRGDKLSPLKTQGVTKSTQGVTKLTQGVTQLLHPNRQFKPSVKPSEEMFKSFKALLSQEIGVPTVCREIVDTLSLIDFDAGRLILATTGRYKEILTARHQTRIDSVKTVLGLADVILTSSTSG